MTKPRPKDDEIVELELFSHSSRVGVWNIECALAEYKLVKEWLPVSETTILSAPNRDIFCIRVIGKTLKDWNYFLYRKEIDLKIDNLLK